MIVEAKNLTKIFFRPVTRQTFAKYFSGKFTSRMKVSTFENLSFTVEKGQIVLLSAPNGKGKTTLLKIIAGIYKPTSGSLQINGSIMPIIITAAAMYRELEISKNIVHFLKLYGFSHKDAVKQSNVILQELSLGEKKDHFLFQLSRGQLSAVSLACGLSVKADLYLIDELLDPLDNDYKNLFLDKIKSKACKENASFIITSHDQRICRENFGENLHHLPIHGLK